MAKYENGNGNQDGIVVDFESFRTSRENSESVETVDEPASEAGIEASAVVPPQVDILSDLSTDEIDKYTTRARSLVYHAALSLGISVETRAVGIARLDDEPDEYEQAVTGSVARRLSQIGLVVLGARGLAEDAPDYALVAASLNRGFFIYELARAAGLSMHDQHVKQAKMMSSDRDKFARQKQIRARTRELLGINKVNQIDYDQKVRPMMVSTGFGLQVATAAMVEDEMLKQLFPPAKQHGITGRMVTSKEQIASYVRKTTNMDAMIRRDNDPRYDPHRLLGTEFRYGLVQLQEFFAADTAIKPQR